jgi:hypothetical protein
MQSNNKCKISKSINRLEILRNIKVIPKLFIFFDKLVCPNHLSMNRIKTDLLMWQIASKSSLLILGQLAIFSIDEYGKDIQFFQC